MRKMTTQQLEQVKKMSVGMLIYFDKFCKTHNLEYAISWGTALGAVRHGGFIPWDDDVDVDMPIKDYDKFVKLWFKYGDKEDYFLQTKKTDSCISTTFNRLRKNNTASILPGEEKIPIHWGVPIDIFPIYTAPHNPFMEKCQKKLLKISRKACRYEWKFISAPKMKKCFFKHVTIVSLWGAKVISNMVIKRDNIFYNWNGMENRKMSVANHFPSKPIVFEGIELQGPANPDKYLEFVYGDYMTPPPEEKRVGHPIGILDLENDSSKYTGYFIRNK